MDGSRSRKDRIDLHTHTIASGHAYNTISEMAAAAAEEGLSVLGITDHAPSMPGSCRSIYFSNLHIIPRQMYSIKLLLGSELNILDKDGNIDLKEDILEKLDLCIASIHQPCYKSESSVSNNTAAIVGAMRNPYVKIIGHPDDGRFPLDYATIAQAAKEENVLLELNNASVTPGGYRTQYNSADNICKMLEFCMQYQASVILSSDAHIFTEIGNHTYVRKILNDMHFPEELIVNDSSDAAAKFIKM